MKGALWNNPNRCCWNPTNFLCLAAKRVLVMVKYEAAEGIRKATLLVLVGVDEGSLMEVSMIIESTNDAALPAEQD